MEPETPANQPTPTEPTEQPAAPETPPAQSPAKGYGKRPAWQWVVIYIVVAIVLYGLAYLIFFHKSGTTGGY